MKGKIAIWGCGRRTERFLKFNYFQECSIIYFVDTYKYGESYHGCPVLSPEQIRDKMSEIDFLIIVSSYFSEIFGICLEMGINRKKLIFADYLAEPCAVQNVDVIKALSPKLYNAMKMNVFRFMTENERDSSDETKLIGKGNFLAAEYTRDYYRYRTFEFLADEIIHGDVEGCVAEFGVFRGTFSALINAKFVGRELYMFDTFEGFDFGEAEKEKKLGRSDDEFDYLHKQTNESIVLESLPYPEHCHICKGFFPASIPDECKSLKYAFVSIDVDFEDSIYAGLEFFYPRLSDGGAIFLHDYNSLNLKGVKQAVQRYESDNNIKLKKVPLADRAGTLVIVG
ncbi:MAG: TylF/MycF family methyltransferase [Treponema sp.]|nr:TylF/MycF family methyltransferase [Treponema sp.]